MSRWSDEELDLLLARVLRTGVLLAAFVVGAGGVLFLMRHGTEARDYRVFHGEPRELRSVSGILAAAADRRDTGVIQLGLLLLIATPIARVALSAAAFAAQRDRLYVTITLIVLSLLTWSLAGS